MEKDTVKDVESFFLCRCCCRVGVGWSGLRMRWRTFLLLFSLPVCVSVYFTQTQTQVYAQFFFLNTHQPSYVHALQRTSSVTITHANRQACICSLTFSDIQIPAHTQTRAHKHTPSIHLDAEDESSPPCGWQSGWQGGGTAPRLAGNMTIVQKPALISPCFAQCIVGLLQTSHEF